MTLNSEICKARSLFITRGILNRDVIPNEIVYSWVRSKLHNISFELLDIKHEESSIDILSLDILSSKVIKFLRTIHPSDSIIYLVNDQGKVIFNTEKQILELPIFTNLSEESIGTNAAGVTLITKEEITVNGCEHYNKVLTNYVSSSIIVEDEVNLFNCVIGIITPHRLKGSHQRLLNLISDHFKKNSSEVIQDEEIEAPVNSLNEVNTQKEVEVKHLIKNKESSIISECKVFTLSVIEAQTIKEALDYYHWNIKKASEALGIGRSTLYRKMKDYNIEKV